ncbi:MAG TPA: dehydrogenase [Planctomycetes bacterium]|nr:dehydrogenase [Planctomycetota bacterium]
MRSSNRDLSRRGFLACSAPLIALPSFVPGMLSASPAERLAVGHVGIGGRGGSLLGMTRGNAQVEVAALCDVDKGHLARARKAAGGEPQLAADYRRLLDNKALDGIVVAAPDHWHATITIAACRAGKHVYCEKPLSHNIAEGRRAVRAARKYDRMVQVGINHRSTEYVRHIVRLVRGGAIGKVRAVKNWMWTNKVEKRTPPPGKIPASLDYDAWLGPAPEAAYHPARVHYNFRWCSDYAGGYMTDWGVHMFNVITFAMGIDHKGPESVEARGTYSADNIYDFPVSMKARWEFKDPDFTLTWDQPEKGGDVLPGERYGMTFYGEDGELRTGFGTGKCRFYRDGKEAPLPREPASVEVPESPGHMQNWVDSIRKRELPIADVEIGHRTTSLCLLGNIALRIGRKLRWDWHSERFFGDSQADALLGREARAAYRI